MSESRWPSGFAVQTDVSYLALSEVSWTGSEIKAPYLLLIVPRLREADGILEHDRCSILRVHHVQVERESNLQAPGVACMFRCSAFDALNTWSEALGGIMARNVDPYCRS